MTDEIKPAHSYLELADEAKRLLVYAKTENFVIWAAENFIAKVEPVLRAMTASAEPVAFNTPWAAVHGILSPDDEGNERSFIRPVHSEGWQIAQTVGPNGCANADAIVAAVNARATPPSDADNGGRP